MSYPNFPAPPINADDDVKHQWKKMAKTMAQWMADVGLAFTAYVDGSDGEDLSAQVGSMFYKYATVQAAVTAVAALGGGVVKIAPGAYVEDVVLPNIAGGAGVIVLEGDSSGMVFLSNAAGDTIAHTGVLGQSLMAIGIDNISLINDGGGLCLDIDGGADTGCCGFSWGLLVKDCRINVQGGGNTIECTRLNSVRIQDCIIGDDPAGALGDTLIEDCADAELYGCLGRNVTIDWNEGGDLPQAARGAVLITSCVFGGTLTVNNESNTFVGADCAFALVVGELTDAAGPVSGYLGFAGRCAGDFDVDAAFDVAAAGTVAARVDHAEIGLTATFTSSGAVRADFTGIGCNFLAAGDNGIVAEASFVDLRGAAFHRDDLSVVGIGAFDRDVHVQDEVLVNGWTTVAQTFANTGGDVPFVNVPTVYFQFDTLADMPCAVTTGPTAAGFTPTSTGNAGSVTAIAILQRVT